MYELLLIPAVGTVLAITLIARRAVGRGFDPLPLATVANAVSLAVMGTAALLWAPREDWATLTSLDHIWIPLGGGTASVLGMGLQYAALRQRATGPVLTISSMSVLVPITLAVSLGWNDPLAWTQMAGMALALAAIAMINLGKSPKLESAKYHWLGLALLALPMTGLSQTSQRYITVLMPYTVGAGTGPVPGARWAFMALVYLACAVGGACAALIFRQRFDRRCLPFALGLAAASMCQFLCMMPLLEHVHTAVVYIVFSGGGIIMVTLVSWVFLRERYKAIVWAGVLVGAAGIVLMRVKW